MAIAIPLHISHKAAERRATVYVPADIEVPKRRKTRIDTTEKHTARIRAEGEATTRMPFSRKSYKTGDGDVLQPRRMNSDHSRFKSWGTLC